MKLNELPDLLERQIDYPAGPTDVRRRIGGASIDAPDATDSMTLDELLAHVEADVYGSPNELFEAIVGSLPEAYVGRKFYDDRGWNPVGPLVAGRQDDDEQSF